MAQNPKSRPKETQSQLILYTFGVQVKEKVGLGFRVWGRINWKNGLGSRGWGRISWQKGFRVQGLGQNQVEEWV